MAWTRCVPTAGYPTVHIAVNGATVVSAMFWQFAIEDALSEKSTVPPGVSAEVMVAV